MVVTVALWATWLSHDHEPKRDGRQGHEQEKTDEVGYQSRSAPCADELTDLRARMAIYIFYY